MTVISSLSLSLSLCLSLPPSVCGDTCVSLPPFLPSSFYSISKTLQDQNANGSHFPVTSKRLSLLSRQQVEVEIHETLLKYDGLIEPAATNQGAWLTESAGALSVLHSAVLTSLAGFSVNSCPTPASYGSTLSEEAQAQGQAKAVRPRRTEIDCGGESWSGLTRDGDSGEDLRRTAFQREGDGSTLPEEGVTSGADASAERTARIGYRGGASRDGFCTTATTTTTPTTVTGSGVMYAEDQRGRRRTRLRNLGLLLARRRQFTASRQVCSALTVFVRRQHANDY